MSDLRFDFEWIDPLGARGAELRATWARLTISVDGHIASRLLDQQSRTVRDAIYLPLYPVAEWFATNWWSLCFEVGSPERLSDRSYADRHNFRAARDGYSLPPVSFTSLGDFVQISWLPEELVTHRVEFLEGGSAHVPLESFQHSLRKLIGAVVTRLREQGVTSTNLEAEWSALDAVTAEEAEFCITAAELGLDPFATDETTNRLIMEASSRIPQSLRREFFAVATLEKLQQEAADVAAAADCARANRADLSRLVALRENFASSIGSGSMPPWKHGYAAARELRQTLDLGNTSLQSFDAIAEAFDVSIQALESAIVDPGVATAVYNVLVAANAKKSPAFAMSRRSDSSARFQFCRGLYEFLGTTDGGPWLITGAPSDRQKRNRAFAAEFLAPAALIKDQVSGAVISSDEVEELATRFGVSSYVIVHQLQNHEIAAVAWP